MGRKRKTDSEGDGKPELEVNSFHEYIYNIRLSWTKHIIPIKYLDPNLDLYVEGYIVNSVKKGKNEDTEEEEETTTIEFNSNEMAKVRPLILSTKFSPYLEVPYKDIFPSARPLTRIKNKETLGEVEFCSIYPDSIKKFEPSVSKNLENLFNLDTFHKDIYYTIPELALMVIKPVDEVTKFVLEHFEPVYKRICYITNKEEMTYKLKIIEAKKIENIDNSHKIEVNIEDLYNTYSNCTRCSLGIKRINRNCNIVPAKGNFNSPKFMFIGEAPGVQEERDGIPFNPQAPAGSLLLKVLIEAGFDKKDCYFTNAVICRPPSEDGKNENSKPTKEHIIACNSRLKNEIVLVKPETIILLGKTAYQAYFGENPQSVVSSTGWVNNGKAYFLPHPSYIARQMSMASGKIAYIEYLDHFKNILVKKLPNMEKK